MNVDGPSTHCVRVLACGAGVATPDGGRGEAGPTAFWAYRAGPAEICLVYQWLAKVAGAATGAPRNVVEPRAI